MTSELNEVCNLIVDCEHKTAPTQKIGYPSIRTPNIGKGFFILNGVNRVSEDIYKQWTRRATPEQNDLILAREAPIGNVAIIPSNLKVCLGQRTVLIRPNPEKVFPKYLLFLLLSDEIQNRIKSISSGATVPHLNMADIRKLSLPELPNHTTQRKIAGVLSAYDDLIENNTRRIAILEEMAQRIYKEWFVDFKYPGHENDKLVESELGPIPEGWEVKKLGEFFTFFRGRNLTKKQMIAGDIPVVSAGINPSGFHNESNVIGPVVTVSASGANAGHISLYLRDIWASDCSYFNSEKTEHFYFYYSTVNNKKREIDNLQRGSAQPHVYPKDLMELQIANPPNNLKDKFNEMSNSNFRHIGILRKKNITLRQTRDLLLPKLISGKVDVSGLGIRN